MPTSHRVLHDLLPFHSPPSLSSNHTHLSVSQTLHIFLCSGPLPKHLLPNIGQAISNSSFETQAKYHFLRAVFSITHLDFLQVSWKALTTI